MTDSHSDYPVEIKLGRKAPDAPVMATDTPAGKKRTFYPTLYIDAVPGLEKLPKEGCVMMRFRRTRLSLNENSDGKDEAGATLEIHAICLPEDMDSKGSLEDVFKKLGKGEAAEDGADYADEDEEE